MQILPKKEKREKNGREKKFINEKWYMFEI